MENNKYFTPDIEDIHIGYECEVFDYAVPAVRIGKDKLLKEWQFRKIEKFESDYSGLVILLPEDGIRVSYLTNKHLETEGWKYYQNIPDVVVPEGYVEYYKDVEWFKVVISISETSHYLDVQKVFQNVQIGNELQEFRNTIYNGECKDINTFRKIIKLLKIN